MALFYFLSVIIFIGACINLIGSKRKLNTTAELRENIKDLSLEDIQKEILISGIERERMLQNLIVTIGLLLLSIILFSIGFSTEIVSLFY